MPNLTPTFRPHPAFRLAGIRRWHEFPTAPQTIPPQWHDLYTLTIAKRIDPSVSYGATCQMDMPNKRFEYLAGYEVSTFDDLPADAGRMIVPAADYAVFTLSTVSEIPGLWQHIFNEWLPSSGIKLSQNSADFERYDETFDPVTRGPLEVWIPIKSQP